MPPSASGLKPETMDRPSFASGIKTWGRDHAQFGVFLERLVVVDPIFTVQGGGAGLGSGCQSFHHACACQYDVQEVLDVCVCYGFRGFLLSGVSSLGMWFTSKWMFCFSGI